MIYLRISDVEDIAEGIHHLIDKAVEEHESEELRELTMTIDSLESDVEDLREIANERQDRIEYLESLLKENAIDFE